MLFRRFSSARSWSCLTAPSDRPSAAATSRILFSSTKRSWITRRCTSGSRSICWYNAIRRSMSSSSRVSGSSGGGSYASRLRSAPVIRQRVRGDPEQPDRQRHSTPLETRNRSQCLLEHLRRDVLSRGPVPGSATDEGIDSVDVPLVDLNKSSRIGLRRLCLSRPLLVSRRAVRIDPSHRGRAVSTSSYVAN